MKSDELFQHGFEAALKILEGFIVEEAPASDAMVRFIRAEKEKSYQEFKTTEPGRLLVLEASIREADAVNPAKWRGFRAGHRAAVRTTNSFFRTGTVMSCGLREYMQDKEERDLADFRAAEKGG